MISIASKIAGYAKDVETKVKQKARTQGRLDVAVENLKEAGFPTVEKAKDYVEASTKEFEDSQNELIQDVEDFENEYSQHLS